jgi:hypothetical protein
MLDRVNKQVTYVPLKPTVIDQFAQDACNHLAEHDVSFADPEVVSGLAAFLNTIAEIVAKRLNEGHSDLLDTANKQR